MRLDYDRAGPSQVRIRFISFLWKQVEHSRPPQDGVERERVDGIQEVRKTTPSVKVKNKARWRRRGGGIKKEMSGERGGERKESVRG